MNSIQEKKFCALNIFAIPQSSMAAKVIVFYTFSQTTNYISMDCQQGA